MGRQLDRCAVGAVSKDGLVKRAVGLLDTTEPHNHETCHVATADINLFLGRELVAGGPLLVTRRLDEIAMELRSHELLEQLAVAIPSVRSEVGTLSGGQRQQVAVARSLLGDPKLVLLDEPTAALGVAQTRQVLALIKRLREHGLGVVVISHNLTDVFQVADRIFVLRLGELAGNFIARETSRAEVVAAMTGVDFGADDA
jgi:D-xylose transport system ATP-binding protein